MLYFVSVIKVEEKKMVSSGDDAISFFEKIVAFFVGFSVILHYIFVEFIFLY